MTTTRTVENDLCQSITDRIIERLESGNIPWRKPWSGGAAGRPRNGISGHIYRGVNVWTLGMAGYSDPRWVTFNQCRKAGGYVRKGERSETVVFWKPWKRTETDDQGHEFDKRGVLLKYFRVFNVQQTEGLNLPSLESTERTHEPIEAAQAVVDRWAGKLGGGFQHEGDAAYYAPAFDRVVLPKPETFVSSEAYYSVAFHEFAHSTGHRSRLAREGVTNHGAFGSHTYSREELVAEFAASFICGMVGIERPDTIENSAAYIQGWVRQLKHDPRALVVAAGHAEKAAEMVMGIERTQSEACETETD